MEACLTGWEALIVLVISCVFLVAGVIKMAIADKKYEQISKEIDRITNGDRSKP